MIYPVAVILLAVVAVAVIMIVVIPQFQTIFLGLLGPGEPLPLPTRIVVGFSNFLAGWGGLSMLVLIIGSSVGINFYYKTPKGRKRIDTILLKTPILGPIFLKIAIARFSRTLSTLLSSGVQFCNRWTLPPVLRQRRYRRSDYERSHGGRNRVRVLLSRCALPIYFLTWFADGGNWRTNRCA